MLKHLHFKTMLLLCALIAGVSSAWAEEAYYTLDGTITTGGNSNYAQDGGGLTQNDIEWSVTGNTTISPWRIGGKSITDVDREAYSKTAMDAAISKIDLEIGDINLEAVNSITLIVASDNSFTSVIQTIKETSITANSTLSFNPSASEWAKGAYYKFVFNVTQSKDSNKYIQFKSAKFYKAIDISKETPVLSFPQDSYTADINDGFTAPALTNETGVTVTYSSSEESVATVDASTGAVTLKGVGSTTITASFAGNDTYNSASAEYALTVSDRNANDGSAEHPYTVAEARAAIDANEGITNVYATGIVSEIVTAFNSQFGNISYNISDDGETTSAQLQAYRGKGIDGANFTSADDIQVGDIVVVYGNLKKYNSTYEFDQDNQLVSLYRIPVAQKEDAELIVEDDFSMEITTTKPVEDIYAATSDGEVTVTSGNPSIVKVENGVLTALAKGTAEITVSIAATDTYKSASAKINVTVTVKDAVQPEGAGAGSGYALVTDASTLADGDRLLITSTGTYTASKVTYNFSWAMAEQDGTIRKTADITIEDNKISTVPNNAQVVTLETAPDGKWYLKVDDNNYLNSSNKGVATSTTKEAFGISITENMATISGNDIYLQCNPNSGNARFAFYSSTQKPIQLFRAFDATSFDITVTAAGWRTLVTAVDATLPEGLTAYVVTEVADNAIKLATATDIKANTPYILEGAAGDYTLTVAESATAPATNLLQISTETTGNGVYVLANDDTKGVGFYKWVGGSLGAGRVYLPAPATAPEFLSFVFDSETTGINDVRGKKADVRGEVYNLNGQRVANPTKGLYIVNGKKVAIK